MLTVKQVNRNPIMPRSPRGEQRRPDTHAAAAMVAKIATGEIEDDVPAPVSEGKNPAAVALGRLGGKARAAGMSARKRRAIAKNAAKARWHKTVN